MFLPPTVFKRLRTDREWSSPLPMRCGYADAARVGKEVMIMTKKIGRSAVTGRFIPVRVAQQQSKTSVVETIKVKKGK